MKGAIDPARAFELASPEERLQMIQLTFNYALAAIKKQQPLPVRYRHKDGEHAGLFICPACEQQTIVNWDACLEYQRVWYCKTCGQLLVFEVG